MIISTAWGCPYEGDVPVSRVVQVAGRAVADGADSVSFGDTTGMATPGRVQSLVGEFRSAYPEASLNLHFHNTRGTGLANVLAALELGVADFDASVGGLGGCPYAPGRPGTSPPRNSCTWCRTWASNRRRPGGHNRRRGGRGADRRPQAAISGAAGRPADPDDPGLTGPPGQAGPAGTARLAMSSAGFDANATIQCGTRR